MSSIGELKKQYSTLDQEQKLVFLGKLVEFLQKHEDIKARLYDSATSAAQRIALMMGAVELRQLIIAVKNEQAVLRKRPECADQELLQLVESFFNGE